MKLCFLGINIYKKQVLDIKKNRIYNEHIGDEPVCFLSQEAIRTI